MNDDRAFERATRDWLEAGSDRTPAPVMDAVLLAVRTTPQERDLRIPWRTPRMTSFQRAATGVAVVVVVAVVAALAIGRMPGPATPAATPTASPSPIASVSPTVATTPSPVPVPSATPALGSAFPGGAMPAGTYHSAAFQPTITLTFPAGWTHRYEDTEGLVLTKGNLEVYVTHSEPVAAAEARAQSRGFTTSPATLGGYSGFTTDVSAPLAASTTIFIDAGLRAWDSTAGWVTRGWVVDMHGSAIALGFYAPPGEFPAALAGVEAILNSLGEAP